MTYCVKCGAQVGDDMSFCPKCGTAVTAITESGNTEIVQTNQSRDRVVTLQSMQDLGVTKTVFKDRIDSVEDKDINDHLFTLYAKLVPPVSEIESLSASINQKSAEIEDAKRFRFYKLPFITIAVTVLVWWYCASQYGETDHLPFIFRPLETATFQSDLFSLTIWSIIYGVVTNLVLSALFSIILFLVKRNTIPTLQNEIGAANQRRLTIANNLRDYICYVPPAYRFAAALSYFVDSYRNTRVSNLKEAVREYDAYARHNQLQESISNMQAMIYEGLSQIMTIQLQTQEQLASINASVWASNFMF